MLEFKELGIVGKEMVKSYEPQELNYKLLKVTNRFDRWYIRFATIFFSSSLGNTYLQVCYPDDYVTYVILLYTFMLHYDLFFVCFVVVLYVFYFQFWGSFHW